MASHGHQLPNVSFMSFLRGRPGDPSLGGSLSKNFVVKSLAKCGLEGDVDLPIVYTCDSEFGEICPDERPLGPGSSYPDSRVARIQFQHRGVIESLGDETGVIKGETGVCFSFKASDLHFDAGLEHDPYYTPPPTLTRYSRIKYYRVQVQLPLDRPSRRRRRFLHTISQPRRAEKSNAIGACSAARSICHASRACNHRSNPFFHQRSPGRNCHSQVDVAVPLPLDSC
jgi:hypothetical protein